MFRDLELWRAEKGLSPWKQLIVKWGGFEEESETIYLTDTREKSQTQFLMYNEKILLPNGMCNMCIRVGRQ